MWSTQHLSPRRRQSTPATSRGAGPTANTRRGFHRQLWKWGEHQNSTSSSLESAEQPVPEEPPTGETTPPSEGTAASSTPPQATTYSYYPRPHEVQQAKPPSAEAAATTTPPNGQPPQTQPSRPRPQQQQRHRQPPQDPQQPSQTQPTADPLSDGRTLRMSQLDRLAQQTGPKPISPSPAQQPPPTQQAGAQPSSSGSSLQQPSPAQQTGAQPSSSGSSLQQPPPAQQTGPATNPLIDGRTLRRTKQTVPHTRPLQHRAPHSAPPHLLGGWPMADKFHPGATHGLKPLRTPLTRQAPPSLPPQPR